MSDRAAPQIRNRVLGDLVYDRIKEMIDEHLLAPGEKIRTLELAGMIGVSQTPVNAALSRLAGEKLIEQRSRQGYFVRRYTNLELSHLFELRAGIESMAIMLCIENANDQQLDDLCRSFDGLTPPLSGKRLDRYIHVDKHFHESIVRYSGNPFLEDLLTSSAYLIKSNQKGLVRPPEDTAPEHARIVDALRNRDGLKARDEIVLHNLRSRDYLRSLDD